ncbi:MAG: TonB-dependent receptor [Sphingomonadaceae bacterium]
MPVSVSVIGGPNLASNNISRLEQVAQRVPSLKIATAPVSDQLNIRGVGSSVNVGFEQSVGTFVDGVYRGRSRSSRAALFDLERVEVLKGPQTTFFGNNAIAGALNISTRKPSDVFEANFSAFGAAEANEYGLEAGVSGPLSDDLAVRVAGRWSGMDGYIKNTATGFDGPRQNDKIGRLSIAWEPSSILKINARADAGRMRARGQFNVETENCPPEAAAGPPRGACARYIAGVGLDGIDNKLDWRSPAGPTSFALDYIELAQTASLDLGFGDLIFTTSYYDHNVASVTDSMPIPAQFASLVGTPAGSPSLFSEDFHQFTQEVRFQTNINDNLELMAGAYYLHSNLAADSYYDFNFLPTASFAPNYFAPATPVAIYTQNREKAETLSAFAAATFYVTSRVRLNVGGRYTTVHKADNRSVVFGSTDDSPGPDNFVVVPGASTALAGVLGVDLGDYVNPSRRDSAFLPTVGIQFNPSRSVMLYGTYSKGFKAGGYSGFASKAEFDPETVNAFEAGIKASLFDRLLDVNVAIYHAKYRNLQETTTTILPNGSVLQAVGNAASSISKGADLSMTIRPMMGLLLTADAGYLDATFSRYPGAPCTILQSVTLPAPCTQDLSGRPRAFAPKFSGSIGAEYAFDFNDDIEIRSSTNVYFSSAYYVTASIDPYIHQPGYAKVDARIGIGPENRRWEVAIIGKNLFNKYTANWRAAVPSAGGSSQALADPKRSIGAQFALQF